MALLLKITVVLVVALVLLRVFRSARASARYLILAAAFSALLLMPVASALLPSIAIQLPRLTMAPAAADSVSRPPAEAAGAGSRAAYQQTTHEAGTVTPYGVAIERRFAAPQQLLRAVWMIGVLLFAAPIVLALRHARLLRRTGMAWPLGNALAKQLARDAAIRRRVRVLCHDAVRVPVTSGLLAPVIVLPPEASEWDEADLRRALIHELEHVRRADWLIQLLARAVCAGYWFHPLVWICWRHLHHEAERACDDAVLRTNEGTTYAAQLVRLAEQVSGNAPILAMAGSGDLASRVRSILDPARRRGRAGLAARLGAAALVLLCIIAIAPLRAGTASEGARRASAQAARPSALERFATTSVRRGLSVQPGVPIPGWVMANARRPLGMISFNEHEFIANSAPIQELIERAYGIGVGGNRPLPFASIEGLPSWRERFDIDARMPRPVPGVPDGQEPPELRAMLQQFLADRFQLEAHWEPRASISYELLRDGPLGPHLTRPDDCPLGNCLPECLEFLNICEYRGTYGRILDDHSRVHRMVNKPIRQFVGNLQLDLRRPIVDRTGLEGPFNLELQYSAQRVPGKDYVKVSPTPTKGGTAGTSSEIEAWRSLSTALREQLGLRLEPRTVSEDVLVVDRIALPSYD